MKSKSIIAAGLLGLASLTAQAVPLEALSGSFNWKLQGTTTEFTSGFGDETTWGIGEITSIKTSSGDDAWVGGVSDGTRLYYMLYGIADLSIVPNATQLDLYNIGCTGGACDGQIHIDIYRTPGVIPGILNQNPNDRCGFDCFTGLTNMAGGVSFLDLILDPGKVSVDVPSTPQDETTATLKQKVDGAVLPTSGDGTFFASVVGGSAAANWDTNGFNLGNSDFDGNFTLKPNLISTGGSCSPAQVAANTCFLGLINDPVQSIAQAVPEPGTMALFGFALLGLGSLRRRRT